MILTLLKYEIGLSIHHYLVYSSGTSANYLSFFIYFVIKVGINAKKPRTNRVIKFLGLMPILSIYFKVKPVCIRIKLFGIKPI